MAHAEAQRAREAGMEVDAPPPPPPPDPPYAERTKGDRDFRICEHCSSNEQTRKLRNRDFNASINILKLLWSELRGEARPGYLCPEPRGRKRKLIALDEEGVPPALQN